MTRHDAGADGTEAMRYSNGCTLGSRRQQIFLNAAFGLCIKGAACLVQNQEARILEKGPCKRNTGPLATAEFSPTVANHSVKSVLEVLNKLPSTRQGERLLQFFITRLLIVDDVVTYRPVEEERVLAYEAHCFTDGIKGKVGDRTPVHQHLPVVRSVVSHEKFEDGRFTCTSVPHNAQKFTTRNLE